MRDSTHVLVRTGIVNFFAVFHGALYGALTLASGGAPIPGRWIYSWGLVAAGMSYVIGGTVVTLRHRVLDRVAATLRAGQTPDASELSRARRLALELPVMLSRTSTSLWLTAAASLPVIAGLVAPGAEPFAIVHAVMVVVVMGSVSSVFIYYVNEAFVRDRLVTLLFPAGQLATTGVAPVTISFKLLVLLMLTCVLPAVALSTASAVGALSPVVALFLGASFFSFGVFQSVFIVRSVSRPVAQLAAQVKRVGDGDLAARAPVVSLDHVGQLAEGFNGMVAALRQAAFVKDTFGRYVTPQVRDEILRGRVALGGELRQATVLFSDIRGFTALSERMAPADVVQFLNRYLDLMVEIVVEHGGTIDKFIGDAVMASFGVPLSRPDDALRAVRTALAMLERLSRWNTERALAGEPAVEIGIGLCTGEVLAGNIGSSRKMEYTVIGDTVNTASRIEQLNKVLGTQLLVSAATWAIVEPHVIGRALAPTTVKGKAAALDVYEVTAERSKERA